MSTRETIERYFAALERGEGWQDLLAEDMTFTSFTSPTRNLRGREAYIAGTRRFYSSQQSFDLRELIVDGNRAVALTRYVIQPPGDRPSFSSDVAEVFTVRDGKIASFDIYFDATPYPR